jgi:hypothetical protein
MRTLTLSVDDLVITNRSEEVPTRCKCGADLRAPRALRHWEYQDQSRSARIERDGSIDWSDELPECGESFLACGWNCAACDGMLLVAREQRIDPVSERAAVSKTVASPTKAKRRQSPKAKGSKKRKARS